MNGSRKFEKESFPDTTSAVSGWRVLYFALAMTTSAYFVVIYGLHSVPALFLTTNFILSFVIVTVAVANFAARGRTLAGTTQLRGAIRSLVKVAVTAMTASPLFLGLWHFGAIALYDGTDASQSRLLSMQSVEQRLFGRSVLAIELDALCQLPLFSQRNAAVDARGKLAAGEAAFARHELSTAESLYVAASAEVPSSIACYRSLFGRVCDDLGMYYRTRSPEMEVANEYFDQALAWLKSSDYIFHDERAYALIQLHQGQYYLARGDYQAAEGLLDQALAFFEQSHELDDCTLSRLYYAAASARQYQGLLRSAQMAFSQAAALQMQTLKSDHPDLSGLVASLVKLKELSAEGYTDASVYRAFNSSATPPESKEELKRSRERITAWYAERIREVCQDSLSGKVMVSAEEEMHLCGVVREQLLSIFSGADFSNQLAHRSLFLAERDERLKNSEPAIFAEILRLDAGCQTFKQLREGEYTRALDIYTQQFGPDDQTVADTLHELAKSLASDADARPLSYAMRKEAEKYFDREIQIEERALDPEMWDYEHHRPDRFLRKKYPEYSMMYPDYRSLLNHIGDAADPSERTDDDGRQRVERLMEQHEYYAKKLYGEDHIEFAQELIFLAVKYDAHRQFAKAQSRFVRALAIINHNRRQYEYQYKIATAHYTKHKQLCCDKAQPDGFEPVLLEPYRIWP